MKCIQCGCELTGEENFCRNCGAPIKKEDTIADEKKESLKLEDEKSEDNNSDKNSKDINLSLDKTTPLFKIENTQELSIENSDSSKKIKKILDELKQNNNSSEINNAKKDVDNSSKDNVIKKEYDDNTKKLDKLLEKKQKDDDIKTDSTVIVDTLEIKNESIKNNEQSNVTLSSDSEKKATAEKDNKEEKDESKKIDNSSMASEKDIYENVIDDEIYEESDENSNKNKSGKVIFLLLLLILSICCIVFLIVVNLDLNKKLSNSTDKNEVLSNKNSNISIEKEDDCITSNNNVEILYNGYDFSKFNNVSIENNLISFSYKNLNLKMNIKTNIDFLDLKAAKDNYKKMLETVGYDISSYGTKVVSEREYMFFESKDSTKKNVLIVYTKGNYDDIFMFVIENEKNELNFDDLTILNQFITSLKQKSSSSDTTVDYFIEK